MPAVFLTSSKGGSGKTTTAINLGEALRRLGLTVMIVCLDGSTLMAVAWRRNFEARTGSPAPLPDVMHMSGSSVNVEIKALKSRFDVVILDAGAGASIESAKAMVEADLVVIPTNGSSSEYITTLAYGSKLREVQLQRSGLPKARVLVNRVRMTSRKSIEMVGRYGEASFPIPPFATAIPDRAVMEQLAGEGVSVFDHKGGLELRDLYMALAKEVCAIVGVKPKKGHAKLGARS